jgi:dolichol-phosphate mannosyltransferase
MADPARPALSVVAPCFNEEGALPEFLRRVGAVLDGLGGAAEIVVVDDGSRDGTWAVDDRGGGARPRIVAVRLMRNHGHQLALTAGLTLCRGERVLIIDADLQDPPELLPDMMALDGSEGADVVYGQRRQREGESLFKRATAAAFYRLIGRMTDVEIPLDAGDFRLMHARVLDLLLAMPERHRFIAAWWPGSAAARCRCPTIARRASPARASIRSQDVRFAADAITAFSVVPLMASMTIGWVMAVVGFAFFVYSISAGVRPHLPGWTSLMAASAFWAACSS